MEKLLKADNLCFNTESRKILEDVSFCLDKKEVLGIAGPSGSGKSTILRIISSLIPFCGGDVKFWEQSIHNADLLEWRRKISLFFQMPVSIGDTIKDNMTHNNYKKVSEERIFELLDICGLNERDLFKDMTSMSVGEQQRLSLARILVNEPEIILLDEPQASLDPSTSKRMLKLLRSLKEEQELSLIYVSHNIQELNEIADKILFLYKGKSSDVMSPDEFMNSDDRIINLFVKGELDE